MKKVLKIIGKVVAVLLVIIIVGFSIFLYDHGNTSKYTVPKEVSAAIKSQAVKKGKNEVRVMSSNLLVSYPSWHSQASRDKGIPNARPRAKMYYELLDTYKPDVVGLQEMCDMWFNCLLRHDGPYKIVQPTATAFTVRLTSLMYNSNTTTLIDKGSFAYEQGDNPRLRRVVWGLFEDKATKKQYVVTSTHFDLIREDKEASLKVMQSQMNELLNFSFDIQKKYNVPIFHTGDFNAVNNIENWKELYPDYTPEQLAEWNEEDVKINQAPSIYDDICNKISDTKLIAKETDFRGSTTVDSPAYDHIFLNGDNDITRFVSISDPSMYKISDHFSIFVDAVID